MNGRTRFTHIVLTGLLAFWATGCLEHNVKTTIHADGSCERTITLNPDTMGVPRTPFPLPAGASWDTTWTKTGDAKHLLTFSKRFNNLEELSREYATPVDAGKIRLDIRARRLFRWFYTYYEYAETYGRFTDFTLVDPHVVLTEEEIERLTYSDTSNVLKEKREEWVNRNVYEALYTRLAQGAQLLQDGSLTPASMADHKEELFRILFGGSGDGKKKNDPDSILKEQSSYRGTKAEMVSELRLTDEGVNAFTEIAARTFHSEAVWKLKDSIRTGWDAMTRMITGRGAAGDSFSNAVVLPGILLETNATDVLGSTATWKFGTDQLHLKGFEMRATSRVINGWAIAVTGVAALALLGLLAVPLVRNRMRPAR